MDVLIYIATAFGLMFVIEGLFYALFPDTMRRIMAQMMVMQNRHIKAFGIGMVLGGVTLKYFFDTKNCRGP